MNSLHEKQRKTLEYLLDKAEGATLDEIAEHLGITRTAAREHVAKVEALDYVRFEDERGSVGRPKRRYLLSDAGHEAFPRQYSWLSNILLELLAEDLGPRGVAGVMRQLAGKVATSMKARFEKAGPSAELIAEVSVALNELGYRTSVRQSDLRKGAVIEATNCVYHSVAKKHPELCQFDVAFIENVSKLDVTLESCIARGGSVCRFCLRVPK